MSEWLLFTLLLNYICETSQLQQCSEDNTKTLTKIPYLLQRDIGTCSDVTDYSTYVTSLLDTCVFTSVPSATYFSACQKQCIYSASCVAITISNINGCEHCVTGSGSGNGNSYAQSKIMLADEALRDFIDGMFFYQLLQTIDSTQIILRQFPGIRTRMHVIMKAKQFTDTKF